MANVCGGKHTNEYMLSGWKQWVKARVNDWGEDEGSRNVLEIVHILII